MASLDQISRRRLLSTRFGTALRLVLYTFLCASVASVTQSPLPVAAFDSSCNPNLQRWYALFERDTPNSTMMGGHARLQTTHITPATSGNVNVTNWVITDGPSGAWAEIGYGYNDVNAGHGPDWYYYYQRTNGTAGYSYPLPYVDSGLQMFATGLGDGGIVQQQVGLESSSCHDYVENAITDEFTSELWDGTWWYWVSGFIAAANSPTRAVWTNQPRAGYVGMN